ncbi:MAG TPA: DUF1015 domain-containing protein [Clostridia bacterium]|nr:DUF1015 domain-containing protein [Clostridia bacterium]
MHNEFKAFGVNIPEILLPAEGTDLSKWAVIACDQYTSQPDYWESVRSAVGTEPSTLNLIFPEIYLKDDDKESRIENINRTMRQYLKEGILKPQKPGLILVDRSTARTPSRKGLIIAVDLECYDYTPGSKTLIRATEGTVLDRIPPRVKIRENAEIELPHIMVLIDDPERTVIEKLYASKEKYKKLYDFELMQGSGHIKAWKIEDSESLANIAGALEKLADPEAFRRKYGLDGQDGSPEARVTYGEPAAPGSAPCSDGVLLFAAGDGNHSLATAKAHWENVKAGLMKEAAAETDHSAIPEHPARYALVELVNVHDDGLAFEPIHRVLFGVDRAAVTDQIKNAAKSLPEVEFMLFDSQAAMEKEHRSLSVDTGKKPHVIPFILEGTYGLLIVRNPASNLEVGTLQAILDELVKNGEDKNGSSAGIEIDYIHGEEVVTEIGSKTGCMGFYLPVMNKRDLFRTVILDGVLPRKTFSMGEAEEKRYYLECRKIK